MKKFMLLTFITVATMGASAQTTDDSFSFNTASSSVFVLQKAELTVNGSVVKKDFSVNQSDTEFLFFYVPKHGLFTISKKQFDDADQRGTIDGKNLYFEIENTTVNLKSASAILNNEEVIPIFVKFDDKYRLNTDSVVIGYGNEEKLPYDWKDQIKTNRK